MNKLPKRILVATDFSEGSDAALESAIDLAAGSGAVLEILYVLELEVEQFPFALAPDDDRSALLSHINRELARRADLAAKEGVTCHTKSVDGNAAAEIVKHGHDIGADLIVVGTHGRRGLAHALLGSVAQRVVQRAARPVLTIPFPKKAA